LKKKERENPDIFIRKEERKPEDGEYY